MKLVSRAITCARFLYKLTTLLLGRKMCHLGKPGTAGHQVDVTRGIVNQ